MEMEYMYMRNLATTRLLSFYALFMAVGLFTRITIRRFACEGTFKHHMQDIVTAFELYGCNIGHIYVFQIYGLGTHLIVLLTVGLYHAFSLKGCTANPITHVRQYLMNCYSSIVTITRVLALVLGGVVGHLTAIFFWPVLMTEFDREILADMHCIAACTTMPVTESLGVEFFGMVLTCTLVINITSLSVDAIEPTMKFLITCLLSGAGLCVGNVYLNPVVASSRVIGCDNKEFVPHLVIYWIAPIGGAAVAVLHKEFTSRNSDLVCFPDVKCETSLESSDACSELKSDSDPELPCPPNTFHQESCTRVSYVQMPPICISRAEELEQEEEGEEEDEEDENSDEVIYSCEKYLDTRRVNDKQTSSMRHRQCIERPYDDTCIICRGYPGSNPAWPSGTATSNQTFGLHNCTPISTAGSCINRPLCDDFCTVSYMSTAKSCCGYRDRMSCLCCGAATRRPFCANDDEINARTLTFGEDNNYMASDLRALRDTRTTDTGFLGASKQPSSSLVPTQTIGNISGDQSYSVWDASRYSHKTDTTDINSATSLNYLNVPSSPTRKRSLLTTFIQPLRDNSQNQGTYSDDKLVAKPAEDELVAKPSFYKLDIIGTPPRKPVLQPVERSSYKPSMTPLPDSPVVQPSQPPKTPIPSSSVVQPSQPPKTSITSSSVVQPSQLPKTPIPSRSVDQPSQSPKTPSPLSSSVQLLQSPTTSSPHRSIAGPSQPSHTFSFHISLVAPKDEHMQQSLQAKSSDSSELLQVRKTSQRQESRSDESSDSPHSVPDSHPKSSHNHHLHKSSHKKHKHTKPEETSFSAHPTSSPDDPHKSSHKSSHKHRIDNHRKHNDQRRSMSRGRTPTTSHLHPITPSPKPSHCKQRKLSPSHTRHRTPSCQRTRDNSLRRSKTTRSKPFHTNPESCMF